MKNSILFLSLTLLLFSCKNDDDEVCSDIVVNTTSLEAEYGCGDTKYMEIELVETDVIIRNQ